VTVAASGSPEPVLLGSAILGAVSAGAFPDIEAAMGAMSILRDVFRPDAGTAAWHSKRFHAFELLQKAGQSA
jgi:D-ribulokinase